jgi:hypothetical protein
MAYGATVDQVRNAAAEPPGQFVLMDAWQAGTTATDLGLLEFERAKGIEPP